MKSLFTFAAVALLATSACHRPGKPAPHTGTPQTDSTVVAMLNDKPITMRELDDSIRMELYETRRRGLETLVIKRLVTAEAKKLGLSEEELFQKIAGTAKEPTDAELRAIYETIKEQIGDASFEDVKPILKPRAEEAAKKVAFIDFLTDLQKKAGFKSMLEVPRQNVEAVGPSMGPANAPVTIVIFSDFQCPYCSRAKGVLDQVMKTYEGKVRLVFRDYPLSFHPQAQKAAEAGLCADAQGKFWPMHDVMFAKQEALGVEDLKAYAKTLGLDEKAFAECLDSGKMAPKIEASKAAAETLEIEGTPAFFVNGIQISGGLALEDFKAVIDAELNK